MNEEVAYLSGIKVKFYRTMAYVFSGITGAVSGFILASRIGVGQPGAAGSYTLDAIAIAFLSSTMFTGKPNVPGVVIGALFLGTVANFLNLMDVSEFYQGLVKGSIFVIAVIISSTVKGSNAGT